MNSSIAKNKISATVWFALRLALLSAVIGAVCGLIGSLFSKSIAFVTALRGNHGYLLYLLPIGGLATVALYKLCKVEGMGTKHVFKSIRENDCLSAPLLPAIFSGTIISHLFGASVGREGAALQIGGVIASTASKILRLDEKTRQILTVCGMGATFSAVFGTPLGACIFAVESIRNIQLGISSLLPSIIASVTAFIISSAMNTPAERFELNAVPDFTLTVLWRAALIALAVGVIGYAFCHILHISEHYSEKLIKNPYIRVFSGGVIIILITLLINNSDYNGGGVFVIERIFEKGTVFPLAFLLKILFTVISAASGYKGGEIVPSFFIGATAGAAMAGMVGIPTPFGAAIGMASIFSSVTKCPVATCFICAEMFGTDGILFFIISSFISILVSGKVSLFAYNDAHGSR